MSTISSLRNSPFSRAFLTLKVDGRSMNRSFRCILSRTKSTIPDASILSKSAKQIEAASDSPSAAANFLPDDSAAQRHPFSGLDDVMMGYIFGRRKATEVAHSVWKCIVQKGDAVVDATCGNGYDTLQMVQLVADSTRKGRVYAIDIQKFALESTSYLLDNSLSQDERELVELCCVCHSKIEEVVPDGLSVRLIAFNLGYLPGGDKKLITRSETTLLALEAAKRILAPGGLISIVIYVGHHGGREEFETVQSFAVKLPVEEWICCKLDTLNRPQAPVPIFLYRRHV